MHRGAEPFSTSALQRAALRRLSAPGQRSRAGGMGLKLNSLSAEKADMGLRSLFRQPQQATARRAVDAVLLNGGETVEVVGESNYLPALLQLTGRRQQEYIRQE